MQRRIQGKMLVKFWHFIWYSKNHFCWIYFYVFMLVANIIILFGFWCCFSAAITTTEKPERHGISCESGTCCVSIILRFIVIARSYCKIIWVQYMNRWHLLYIEKYIFSFCQCVTKAILFTVARSISVFKLKFSYEF